MLGAKVWDDTGASNAEFADASGTAYAVGDVNAMEQRFLHLIEYNVAISRQLYTRIYFELRELCERREVQLPLRPLSVAELDTIERRDGARHLRRLRKGPQLNPNAEDASCMSPTASCQTYTDMFAQTLH